MQSGICIEHVFLYQSLFIMLWLCVANVFMKSKCLCSQCAPRRTTYTENVEYFLGDRRRIMFVSLQDARFLIIGFLNIIYASNKSIQDMS